MPEIIGRGRPSAQTHYGELRHRPETSVSVALRRTPESKSDRQLGTRSAPSDGVLRFGFHSDPCGARRSADLKAARDLCHTPSRSPHPTANQIQPSSDPLPEWRAIEACVADPRPEPRIRVGIVVRAPVMSPRPHPVPNLRVCSRPWQDLRRRGLCVVKDRKIRMDPALPCFNKRGRHQA